MEGSIARATDAAGRPYDRTAPEPSVTDPVSRFYNVRNTETGGTT